ncbi:hypothetical protein C8R44DRAFT_729163 [Mycena epipterygia]|nr:hypothetical protein C8R44DRAFT_729163 [Mycena epipterygia]
MLCSSTAQYSPKQTPTIELLGPQNLPSTVTSSAGSDAVLKTFGNSLWLSIGCVPKHMIVLCLSGRDNLCVGKYNARHIEVREDEDSPGVHACVKRGRAGGACLDAIQHALAGWVFWEAQKAEETHATCGLVRDLGARGPRTGRKQGRTPAWTRSTRAAGRIRWRMDPASNVCRPRVCEETRMEDAGVLRYRTGGDEERLGHGGTLTQQRRTARHRERDIRVEPSQVLTSMLTNAHAHPKRLRIYVSNASLSQSNFLAGGQTSGTAPEEDADRRDEEDGSKVGL